MKRLIVSLFIIHFPLFVSSIAAQSLPVYLDETKPLEQRIDDALRRSQTMR